MKQVPASIRGASVYGKTDQSGCQSGFLSKEFQNSSVLEFVLINHVSAELTNRTRPLRQILGLQRKILEAGQKKH